MGTTRRFHLFIALPSSISLKAQCLPREVKAFKDVQGRGSVFTPVTCGFLQSKAEPVVTLYIDQTRISAIVT